MFEKERCPAGSLFLFLLGCFQFIMFAVISIVWYCTIFITAPYSFLYFATLAALTAFSSSDGSTRSPLGTLFRPCCAVQQQANVLQRKLRVKLFNYRNYVYNTRLHWGHKSRYLGHGTFKKSAMYINGSQIAQVSVVGRSRYGNIRSYVKNWAASRVGFAPNRQNRPNVLYTRVQ